MGPVWPKRAHRRCSAPTPAGDLTELDSEQALTQVLGEFRQLQGTSLTQIVIRYGAKGSAGDEVAGVEIQQAQASVGSQKCYPTFVHTATITQGGVVPGCQDSPWQVRDAPFTLDQVPAPTLAMAIAAARKRAGVPAEQLTRTEVYSDGTAIRVVVTSLAARKTVTVDLQGRPVGR